jgi:hypothetical protein
LYTKYPTLLPLYTKNGGTRPSPPQEISRLASLVGISNLISNCLIPPHVDVNPAIEGRCKRKLLRPLKSRLFSNSFRCDKGTIFEYHHTSFSSCIKYDKNHQPLLTNASFDQFNLASYCTTSSLNIDLDISLPKKINIVTRSDIPGWVFYIKNSKVELTMSFKSFYNQVIQMDLEHKLVFILESLMEFTELYTGIFYCLSVVPELIVNCDSILHLVQNPFEIPLKIDWILKCLFNRSYIEKLMKQPGQLFKNHHGKHHAAKLIQLVFRKYLHRFMFIDIELIQKEKY